MEIASFRIIYSKNEKQLGVTKNFEKAILKCTGDIVFLCDQDDVWLPGKIHEILNIFEFDEDVGLVFSNAHVTDSNLNSFGYTMWDVVGFNRKKQHTASKGNALSILVKSDVATGATMAFRANLIKYIFPIPSLCFHDAWITFIATTVSKIVAIEKPLILYRQHDANIIGGRRISLFQHIQKSIHISPQWFDNEILRSNNLLQRIREIHEHDVHGIYTEDLEKKIRHLLNRKKMFGAPFWQRIFPVARELLTFRYFKYSRGVFSIFVDLFIR